MLYESISKGKEPNMSERITIFDYWNYVDPEEWRDEIIDYYDDGRFEDGADADDKWDSISDDEKWHFLAQEQELIYEDEKANLQSAIGESRLVCQGTAGVWNGTFEGGFIAGDLQDAISQLRGQDYGEIGFYQEDGQLHITFTHHDGTHDIIARTITSAGEEWLADNAYNYDISDWEQEATIFGSDEYSRPISIV